MVTLHNLLQSKLTTGRLARSKQLTQQDRSRRHFDALVLIDAVPKKISLGDKIRNAVENVRIQKRVRALAFKIKPARPEIDDPVMTLQEFAAE